MEELARKLNFTHCSFSSIVPIQSLCVTIHTADILSTFRMFGKIALDSSVLNPVSPNSVHHFAYMH